MNEVVKECFETVVAFVRAVEWGYEITGIATTASFVAALIAVMLQVFPKLRKSPSSHF